MRRSQLNALFTEHRVQTKYWSQLVQKGDFKTPVRAMLLTGPHKNRPGFIERLEDLMVTVWVEGTSVVAKYEKVALLDGNDLPIIEAVRDATGREIQPGSVLCFSTGGSKNPHALEIGRVTKVNDSGTVSVMSAVHNGRKAKRLSYASGTVETEAGRAYTVTDPDRAILLPVSETLTQRWIDTDFGDFLG